MSDKEELMHSRKMAQLILELGMEGAEKEVEAYIDRCEGHQAYNFIIAIEKKWQRIKNSSMEKLKQIARKEFTSVVDAFNKPTTEKDYVEPKKKKVMKTTVSESDEDRRKRKKQERTEKRKPKKTEKPKEKPVTYNPGRTYRPKDVIPRNPVRDTNRTVHGLFQAMIKNITYGIMAEKLFVVYPTARRWADMSFFDLKMKGKEKILKAIKNKYGWRDAACLELIENYYGCSITSVSYLPLAPLRPVTPEGTSEPPKIEDTLQMEQMNLIENQSVEDVAVQKEEYKALLEPLDKDDIPVGKNQHQIPELFANKVKAVKELKPKEPLTSKIEVKESTPKLSKFPLEKIGMGVGNTKAIQKWESGYNAEDPCTDLSLIEIMELTAQVAIEKELDRVSEEDTEESSSMVPVLVEKAPTFLWTLEASNKHGDPSDALVQTMKRRPNHNEMLSFLKYSAHRFGQENVVFDFRREYAKE